MDRVSDPFGSSPRTPCPGPDSKDMRALLMDSTRFAFRDATFRVLRDLYVTPAAPAGRSRTAATSAHAGIPRPAAGDRGATWRPFRGCGRATAPARRGRRWGRGAWGSG